MMPITHHDLDAEENLARRVLVRARVIAPCVLDFDPDSDEGQNAIAILMGVIAEIPAAGSRRTKSIARNGTSMSLETAISSAFDGDATISLRSLCGAERPRALPLGSFPATSPIGRVWPEGEYS